MARFAFVTWDGGGNVPLAVGLAQELAVRGHDAVFIGYEVQRASFERRLLPFVTLSESGRFDIYATAAPAERIAGLIRHVWACREHLDEVAAAFAATSADVLVVDFSMQGAIAAAARSANSWAVLAHSSVAGLTPPPESPMGAARLTATNRLRSEVGLPLLDRLTDAWANQPTIVTTIPALDPAAKEPHRLCCTSDRSSSDSRTSRGDPHGRRGITARWCLSVSARPVSGTRAAGSATPSRLSPATQFESWCLRRKPWSWGRSPPTRPSDRSCPIVMYWHPPL
jgi:hypothetical protein